MFNGRKVAYYSLMYNNGDVCDLTGQPRKTELRAICAADGATGLLEVAETATCRCERGLVRMDQIYLSDAVSSSPPPPNHSDSYQAVVAVTSLCRLKAFAEKEQVIHKINCVAK